jgi:hypothetical protein
MTIFIKTTLVSALFQNNVTKNLISVLNHNPAGNIPPSKAANLKQLI